MGGGDAEQQNELLTDVPIPSSGALTGGR
jgi:hypothetical protein